MTRKKPASVCHGEADRTPSPTSRRPLPEKVCTAILDACGSSPDESETLHEAPDQWDRYLKRARSALKMASACGIDCTESIAKVTELRKLLHGIPKFDLDHVEPWFLGGLVAELKLRRESREIEGHLCRILADSSAASTSEGRPPGISFSGRGVSYNEAAEVLGYPSADDPCGDALRKAIPRAPTTDPLSWLAPGGPGRIEGRKRKFLRIDAVRFIASRSAAAQEESERRVREHYRQAAEVAGDFSPSELERADRSTEQPLSDLSD
jgi:hypothetical protein